MRRFFAWLLSNRYGLCESWDDTFFSPLLAFSSLLRLKQIHWDSIQGGLQ
jgi:hypothetical protein